MYWGIGTNDDELTCAFQKMKSPIFNFVQKPFPAYLTLDPGHGASHDATFRHGLRREHLFDPMIGNLAVYRLHVPSSRAAG
jgi:hypothetical protein